MRSPCSRKVTRKHATVSSLSKRRKKLIFAKENHLPRQSQTPVVEYEPQPPHLQRQRWLRLLKLVLKKVCNHSLFIHLILTTSWTPAKINSRRDFASSSTAQAAGHVMPVSHMDSGSRTDVLEGGEVWQADWVNASGAGGLLSGTCFLIFTVLIIIIHSFCYRTTAGRTFSLREPGTCFAGYHGWSCPRNTFYSKWYGFWWYVFGNSCL